MMKIRNGFVSNSSSSSFVIMAEGETATVRDVARIMVNDIIREIKVDRYPDWKDDIQSKKKWIKDLENIDENTSIHFPSCNYDTWIKKVGDRILVSTCDNTPWDIPNQARMSEKTLEELKHVMSGDDIDAFSDCYNYDFYLESHFKDFYSLIFGIVGRETIHSYGGPNYSYEDNLCKKIRDGRKCDAHLWETNIGIKCPICDAHVFKRKEKLEQLNKL